MSARAKHTSWISAPSSSFDPYGRSYVRGRVGAVTAKGVLELGKQGIDVSDQIVRDLDIPVMAQALALLDTVYAIADSLGVGPQVRTAVTAIRGATYAVGTASAIVGPTAVTAAAGVFAGIGGIAALGAIGVVVFAVASLFGGGDDEAAEAARKQAQKQINHLRDRLTLAEFAAEQHQTAKDELLLSALPWMGPAEHKAASAQAAKLAKFYEVASASLPKSEAALFESLSNLARWTAALHAYEKLAQSKKDVFDSIGFGTTQPRLPWQLKGPIQAETAKLQKLVAAVEAERPGAKVGGATLALLLAAASAGLYAAYNPAGAAALARSAGSKVIGAGRAGIAKLRRVTP